MPLLIACLSLVAAGFAYTHWRAARIAADFPPRGRFEASIGGRLHYVERPAVGTLRATVLLLHGASGNQADVMGPLGDRLAALGFRVIAIDRPGHGWSERPGGRADASPARQAALIRAALARLGITQAIVVGHSWSGALAANFALDHADFTQGLVLLAPVTHPWPGGVTWYYTPASTPGLDQLFTRLLTLPAGERSLDAGVRSVFAPHPPPPHYARATGLALVLRPAEFMANAQDVAGLKAFVTAQAPRLSGIRAPTVIVTGDKDGVVLTRIHSYGSARDIPGAVLVVLPGVGHSPHHSAPDAVADAIEGVAKRAGV